MDADIAKLALVYCLHDFGIKVMDANNIAQFIMERSLKCDINTSTPDIIISAIYDKTIVLHQHHGEWKVKCFTNLLSNQIIPIMDNKKWGMFIKLAEIIKPVFEKLHIN
jgi:hypothetical protein